MTGRIPPTTSSNTYSDIRTGLESLLSTTQGEWDPTPVEPEKVEQCAEFFRKMDANPPTPSDDPMAYH
jgi:hypothetical protein